MAVALGVGRRVGAGAAVLVLVWFSNPVVGVARANVGVLSAPTNRSSGVGLELTSVGVDVSTTIGAENGLPGIMASAWLINCGWKIYAPPTTAVNITITKAAISQQPIPRRPLPIPAEPNSFAVELDPPCSAWLLSLNIEVDDFGEPAGSADATAIKVASFAALFPVITRVLPKARLNSSAVW